MPTKKWSSTSCWIKIEEAHVDYNEKDVDDYRLTVI